MIARKVANEVESTRLYFVTGAIRDVADNDPLYSFMLPSLNTLGWSSPQWVVQSCLMLFISSCVSAAQWDVSGCGALQAPSPCGAMTGGKARLAGAECVPSSLPLRTVLIGRHFPIRPGGRPIALLARFLPLPAAVFQTAVKARSGTAHAFSQR